jgi:phosphoglycerate kinase
VRLDGSIEDTNRIDAALKTIKKIIADDASEILLIAHRGKPDGIDPHLTFVLVAEYLAYVLGLTQSVQKIKNFLIDLPAYKIGNHIYLLENIRFDEREEENNANLVSAFTSAYDSFVFEAFATAHRAHASTVGVSRHMESVAGYKVLDEVKHLELLRDDPQKPCVYIIGGAKIEDKLPIIENVSQKVNKILVGGAVANTFLKSRGEHVKGSLVEDDLLKKARYILEKFGEKIQLPVDHIWNDGAIVDIGPETVKNFEHYLDGAQTVFWNGCLGKTDDIRFEIGTVALGKYLARLKDATRVVAGGDTVGVLDNHNLAKKMSFISTGGGAALEFLAGKELPALKALGY